MVAPASKDSDQGAAVSGSRSGSSSGGGAAAAEPRPAALLSSRLAGAAIDVAGGRTPRSPLPAFVTGAAGGGTPSRGGGGSASKNEALARTAERSRLEARRSAERESAARAARALAENEVKRLTRENAQARAPGGG
jgi:hypothetical protein